MRSQVEDDLEQIFRRFKDLAVGRVKRYGLPMHDDLGDHLQSD